MNRSFIIGSLLLITISLFGFRMATLSKQEDDIPPAPATDCTKQTGLAKVVCLAEAFKTTLSKEQLALLELPYSKQSAVRWSNFPQAFSRPNRVGIALGSLSPAQLSAAKALMAAVLALHVSNEGYDEMEGIMAADTYFGQKTGKPDVFGAGNYYMAFLGKPTTTGLWELQFGGHHFAFANTYSGGKLTGATPSFRGVEPMATITVDGHNYQPIEQEKEIFHTIIESMNAKQKDSARLSGTYSDLLLGPGQDGQFPKTKQGIRIGSLSTTQQKEILKAIGLYVADLDSATAKQLMARYLPQLPDTYLCYSGSGTMSSQNDYIRLDGPNLWIEYSVQPSRDFPGTTHPHSVWRDKTTDYGGN